MKKTLALFAALILSLPPVSWAALSDNLIACWALDETSGDATDSVGSNTLTDTNTVGTATGKVSNARDFESGSSEYFSKADNADLSMGDIDFSFAGWVQLESKPGANMSIFGKDNGGSSGEYFLFWDTAADRFKFQIFASDGFGGGITITANNFGAPSTATWYFIAAWYDAAGNTINISVNDGTPDSVAHIGGTFDGTNTFRLGNNGFATPWDGLLDEWAVWKKVLSSAEITELYNGGSGRACSYISGGAAASNVRRRLMVY